MPQLYFEYSSNIIEKTDMAVLLKKCHAILAEKLPTDIQHCKSRLIEYKNYYVGDGDNNNAFIHVAIHVMPGRKTETLEIVSESIIKTLRTHFKKSLEEIQLQITVAMHELPNIYLKVTE